MKNFLRFASVFLLPLYLFAGPVVVTQTTNSSTLASYLQGSGVTITSVTATTGNANQFGVYTGFNTAPVTFPNGVVLSTGYVTQVVPGSAASSDMGGAGTSEFNAYGPGHITNFGASYDVAKLAVQFSLATESQIAFDFVFGSIEYPVYTNQFTDSFLAFLDGTGTANQIVFDNAGNAVQVGSTFASSLRTDDVNTVFGNPHGLVVLKTVTLNNLTAGNHTLFFEIGDVNDHVLDSAVFLTNLRTTSEAGGTTGSVPEPASLAVVGCALVGLALARRKRSN